MWNENNTTAQQPTNPVGVLRLDLFHGGDDDWVRVVACTLHGVHLPRPVSVESGGSGEAEKKNSRVDQEPKLAKSTLFR